MMPDLLDKIIKGIVTATSKNADVKKKIFALIIKIKGVPKNETIIHIG
jgi:hypothetical protein